MASKSKNQNLEDETTNHINFFSSTKARVPINIGIDLQLTKISLRVVNIQKSSKKCFKVLTAIILLSVQQKSTRIISCASMGLQGFLSSISYQ